MPPPVRPAVTTAVKKVSRKGMLSIREVWAFGLVEGDWERTQRRTGSVGKQAERVVAAGEISEDEGRSRIAIGFLMVLRGGGVEVEVEEGAVAIVLDRSSTLRSDLRALVGGAGYS